MGLIMQSKISSGLFSKPTHLSIFNLELKL